MTTIWKFAIYPTLAISEFIYRSQLHLLRSTMKNSNSHSTCTTNSIHSTWSRGNLSYFTFLFQRYKETLSRKSHFYI